MQHILKLFYPFEVLQLDSMMTATDYTEIRKLRAILWCSYLPQEEDCLLKMETMHWCSWGLQIIVHNRKAVWAVWWIKVSAFYSISLNPFYFENMKLNNASQSYQLSNFTTQCYCKAYSSCRWDANKLQYFRNPDIWQLLLKEWVWRYPLLPESEDKFWFPPPAYLCAHFQKSVLCMKLAVSHKCCSIISPSYAYKV